MNGLRDETRRAWARSPPLRPTAETPAPGDVVVLERCAEFDVEWAVLERRSPDRLLVVAADGQPLVGSADVAVPAAEPGGPLVLRCRFGGWVDAGSLAPAIRTGTLAPGAVARARDRRDQVGSSRGAGAAPAGCVPGLEVDDDSEYRSWVRETLEPAWAALAGERFQAPGGESRVRRFEARRRPAGRRRHHPRWLALAATALLLLGATAFWRQHRELLDQRGVAQSREREAEQLRRDGLELEREHRRQLDAAQADRERLESELGRRLDAALQDAVFHPVVKPLRLTRSRRGGAERLRLDARASHVILVLELPEPRPGQVYRAELLRRATNESVRVADELREDPLGGLWIGLPTALLAPGEYLLRIFEAGADAPEPVSEYPFQVVEDEK